VRWKSQSLDYTPPHPPYHSAELTTSTKAASSSSDPYSWNLRARWRRMAWVGFGSSSQLGSRQRSDKGLVEVDGAACTSGKKGEWPTMDCTKSILPLRSSMYLGSCLRGRAMSEERSLDAPYDSWRAAAAADRPTDRPERVAVQLLAVDGKDRLYGGLKPLLPGECQRQPLVFFGLIEGVGGVGTLQQAVGGEGCQAAAQPCKPDGLRPAARWEVLRMVGWGADGWR
jgi:hypothetical protein